MQITITITKGKGAKAEKKVFNFSAMQIEALLSESFEDLEEARTHLGRQARQVLTPLVKQELFTATKAGRYIRTALGSKVADKISERL